MKKRMDIFTILSTIFTLIYSISALSYILEYYLSIRLSEYINETVAYIIAYISTLGGALVGESQGIIIIWGPIIAVIIGIIGWFSRDRGRTIFLILPICTMIIPLLMLLFQMPVVISKLYYISPFVSLIILVIWSIADWFTDKEF